MADDELIDFRLQSFKHRGKTEIERRRMRSEVTIGLRKNKQEIELMKRRNVSEIGNDELESDNRLIDQNLYLLLEEAKSTIPDVQLKAIRALVINSSRNSVQTQEIVSAGVVPLFLNLLNSPNQTVCEEALWALGNIIADRPILHDYVIGLNIVPKLLMFINPTIPVTIMINITWVIANLCMNKYTRPAQHIIDELLPALNYLTTNKDIDILYYSVQTINYLTGKVNQIQRVIDSGIVPNLIPLLSHKEFKVQRAALRCIGNIVTGTDDQTQVVLDAGALCHFPALLTHSKELICREAVWLLSNVTAGNQKQVQAVIDAGLIEIIVEHLSKGEFKMQKEAAWVINNLTFSKNSQHIVYVINTGVISPMCALLSYQDTEVIPVVLHALKNMLKSAGSKVETIARLIEECGGLDKIEQLQNHRSWVLHKLASGIFDRYFSEKCSSSQPPACFEFNPTDTNTHFKF